MAREREEATMIELMILLAVIAGLWLFFAVIGLVFKLIFGVIGGLFGLLGALLGGVLAIGLGLALMPLLLLAMLPFLVPALLLVGVIWLIVRAARTPAPTQAATH